MPDDHSKVVPLLPIPNRTVKRLSADDSADSRVKVGHRQATTAKKRPVMRLGVFFSTLWSCREVKVRRAGSCVSVLPCDGQCALKCEGVVGARNKLGA